MLRFSNTGGRHWEREKDLRTDRITLCIDTAASRIKSVWNTTRNNSCWELVTLEGGIERETERGRLTDGQNNLMHRYSCVSYKKWLKYEVPLLMLRFRHTCMSAGLPKNFKIFFFKYSIFFYLLFLGIKWLKLDYFKLKILKKIYEINTFYWMATPTA